MGAVRNHLLAVHTHFHWFKTKRALLHKLARRQLAACDLLLFACLHGRGSALLASVQNHLLAVQNQFQWFGTKRARLHKLARRPASPRKRHLADFGRLPYVCLHGRGSALLAAVQNHCRMFRTKRARLHKLARRHLAACDLLSYVCLHGRGSALLAAVQNHLLAVQNHFRWFKTKRARLHKLARRPNSPRKRHLAACDRLLYVCLHGRGSALLAAVHNHLLAVRNHFRWFRTKRARLHKLARRHLAASDLLSYFCLPSRLHGRGSALMAAVQNHVLAVQNHCRWFRTKRACLHKLARRHLAACDLLLFVCLHGRDSAPLASVQNHLLAVQNHVNWFRTKRARLHKLAMRPTSPRKRHLAACDRVLYVCLHGRGFALLAAVQNHQRSETLAVRNVKSRQRCLCQ